MNSSFITGDKFPLRGFSHRAVRALPDNDGSFAGFPAADQVKCVILPPRSLLVLSDVDRKKTGGGAQESKEKGV